MDCDGDRANIGVPSALEMPFLLLPFRPASDPSAARSFIRNYFNAERGLQLHGQRLSQELLLTEPMVSTNTRSEDGLAEVCRCFAVWSNGAGADWQVGW